MPAFGDEFRKPPRRQPRRIGARDPARVETEREGARLYGRCEGQDRFSAALAAGIARLYSPAHAIALAGFRSAVKIFPRNAWEAGAHALRRLVLLTLLSQRLRVARAPICDRLPRTGTEELYLAQRLALWLEHQRLSSKPSFR
ncbi:MAG TPA: hypothetical protein VG735_07445, partial [Caulobacterales bacterium]|nr:hypothetical protein [Caulobacterales bacterium]